MKFVRATSPNGTYVTYVNVDKVSYVRQANNDPNTCILSFDKEHGFDIGISADEFVALAEQ